MALTYEEGMATLRSVFPAWDVEVLAQLLEANDGHLENTIDMALSMEPPAAAAPSSSSSSYPAPAAAARSPPPAPAAAYGSPSYAGAQRSPRASPREKQRRSRVTLPDDFLRLPGDSSTTGGASSSMSEQERQDAALAQMMQDEIFRQELFQNEEFSAHFGGAAGARGGGADSRRSSTSSQREKSAAEIANETYNMMSTKFSVMSEAMKKRAHEMYLKFQTRSDAPAKQDPYSHRPLMADDSSDEDEDDAVGARNSAGDMRQRHAQDTTTPHHGNAFSPSGGSRESGAVSRRGINKKDD